uniref:Uncharacterized protein n=1 Tax=Moniliophthora roreri TaxID=221103 RepID=A0A0W0GE10_MONRR
MTGASDSPPPNPLLSKNPEGEESENSRMSNSSSPTTTVSMAQFLNVVNATNLVTTLRTVEITSVWYVECMVLTISLRIAHDFNRVSEFLLQALPETIQLLIDLRMITVMPLLSATLLENLTSGEGSPTTQMSNVNVVTFTRVDGGVLTLMLTTREPITVTTQDRDTCTFLPTNNNPEEFFLMLRH